MPLMHAPRPSLSFRCMWLDFLGSGPCHKALTRSPSSEPFRQEYAHACQRYSEVNALVAVMQGHGCHDRVLMGTPMWHPAILA